MNPLTVKLFHREDAGYFNMLFMNHAPMVGDKISEAGNNWEVVAREWVVLENVGDENVKPDTYELNLIVK